MKQISWLFILLLTITIINYPNPFNPKGGESATFECTSDSTLETTLYIYDMSARMLYQKVFSLTGGATSRLTWNGYTDANERAANGVYLYQLIDTARNRVGRGKIWIINR